MPYGDGPTLKPKKNEEEIEDPFVMYLGNKENKGQMSLSRKEIIKLQLQKQEKKLIVMRNLVSWEPEEEYMPNILDHLHRLQRKRIHLYQTYKIDFQKIVGRAKIGKLSMTKHEMLKPYEKPIIPQTRVLSLWLGNEMGTKWKLTLIFFRCRRFSISLNVLNLRNEKKKLIEKINKKNDLRMKWKQNENY